MDLSYVGLGVLSILGGVYMRRNPQGWWNRFAGEYTEMWRDPDANEKMARGAPVVGTLLIIGGLIVVVAGVFGI